MREPSAPQTNTNQSDRQRERQGNVVDGAEQENARVRETLAQMGEATAEGLNEAGRTNESDERGNPRESVEGRLPAPSQRETGR